MFSQGVNEMIRLELQYIVETSTIFS